MRPIKNPKIFNIVVGVCILFAFSSIVHAQSLLSPSETGFGGASRDTNYEQLMTGLYGNGNVVQIMTGNKMWVPWYKSSSSAQLSDLQSGSNCNTGTAIDYTHNCMVTDEFSQVGILVSMGKDQTRMNQFYNTVKAIKSTFGSLPAWRVDRNGDSIEVCKPGVDGNCDTASDGTARIIIALYTAAKNPYFTDATMKSNYAALATQLTNDFLTYEVDQTCRPSSLGNGQICYWMAGGSQVKKAGIGSYAYAYTGYFADGTIAMLAAYSATGNQKYLDAAKSIEQNYLQAANFNGNTFTAPPGKSFKWAPDSTGVLRAQCTESCSPTIWDSMDASRAAGMCQANYYAHQMGVTLPGLDKYCSLWSAKYMTNTNSAPLQYTPDGSAGSYQSGYFAQGLEALFQSGGNPSLFRPTLDNALSHYSLSTKTWDYAPSFGVYTEAFAVRALGMGIGRDAAAFTSLGIQGPAPQPAPAPAPTTNTTTNTTSSTTTSTTTPTTTISGSTTSSGATTTSSSTSWTISGLPATCTASGSTCTKKSDSTSGSCRTVLFGTAAGDLKMFACTKDGGYVEIYLQQSPTKAPYKACLANGCVSDSNGFARFIPVVTSTGSTTASTTTSTSSSSTTTSTSGSSTSTTTGTSGSTTSTSTTTTGTTSTSTASTSTTGSTSGNVMALSLIVKPSGNKLSDSADGSSCRIVKYMTPYGEIDAKVCNKGQNQYNSYNYEMYQLTQPNGAQVCFNTACVGVTSGFAAFSN